MEVAGASPLARFCARGTGSAGLGRGEIRSTSATGSGSTIVLDLKEEGAIKNLYFFGPIMVRRVERYKETNTHFTVRLLGFLVLESPAAFSTSTWSSSEAVSS